MAGAFEREELEAFADFGAAVLLLLAFELLDFDELLGRAALVLVLLCVERLRGLRSGRFQSTALSARKLAGISIGPSA